MMIRVSDELGEYLESQRYDVMGKTRFRKETYGETILRLMEWDRKVEYGAYLMVRRTRGITAPKKENGQIRQT